MLHVPVDRNKNIMLVLHAPSDRDKDMIQVLLVSGERIKYTGATCVR